MLFDIDDDDGVRIAGWVVPDHPSVVPAVVVVPDHGPRRTVAATRFRRSLKEERLHETGICGFVLDDATCPGLAAGDGLMVFEERSNVLIYRRATLPAVAVRHFHLQTEPAEPFADLRPLFQMSYGSVELLGEESVVSILNIGFTSSVFVSGAVLYRRYEPYLSSGGFLRSILLSPPAQALAATLLHLRGLAREDTQRGDWRSLGKSALVEAFARVDLTDPAALARAFAKLPDDAVAVLADPVTRLLAGRDSQEVAREEHVGTALDSLAGFDVIGFDDDHRGFARALEARLGPGARLGTLSVQPPELFAIAAALEGCEPARDLVQLDGALIASARQALADAGAAASTSRR